MEGLGKWLVKKAPTEGSSDAPTINPKASMASEGEKMESSPKKASPKKASPKKASPKKASPKARAKETPAATAAPSRPTQVSRATPKSTTMIPNEDEAESSDDSHFSPSSSRSASSPAVSLHESSPVPSLSDNAAASPAVGMNSMSDTSPYARGLTKRARSPTAASSTAANIQPRKRVMPDKVAAPVLPKASYAKASSLDGIAVVFTGEFDNQSRAVIESNAKALGVLVRSAVSGKTDYLVHGSRLEDGRSFEEGSKYKSAMAIVSGQKKGIIKILDENAWEELLSSNTVDADDAMMGVESPPVASLIPPAASEPLKTGPSVEPSPPAEEVLDQTLWVERYRPQKPEDVLGNRPIVNKLTEWLRDWHDVCILGHTKVPQGKPKWGGGGGGGFPEAERINARACMLSGPPGIGKTTTALAVARSLGFSVNEFNASDNRSASDMTKLKFLTQAGRTLFDMNYFERNSKSSRTNKTVIIFDEMDGLSAGDRGGAQTLTKLIENTRVPIICICNDRYSQKVKTLSTKCLDLKFNRPSITEIQKRLSIICNREGHAIEANALAALIESSSNDIRSCVNELQAMIAVRQRKEGKVTVRYGDIKDSRHVKDDGTMSKSPFDICRELLTLATVNKLKYKDREELFFIDHDLVPKLISQNYIASAAGLGGWGAPKAASSPQDELRILDRIRKGSTMIAKGDQCSASIWQRQAWYLLPDVAFYSAVGPTYHCAKSLNRVDFPSFMGKMSTRNKNKRLLKEISLNMNNVKLNLTTRQLRDSGYLELCYAKAMKPLVNGFDAEAALAVFNGMGLTRQLLVDNIIPLRLKNQDALYEKVDSKARSTLTRLENAANKGFVNVSRAVKGDQDEDSLDDLIKANSKAKAKSKTKGKAKGKSKAKSKAKPKSK